MSTTRTRPTARSRASRRRPPLGRHRLILLVALGLALAASTWALSRLAGRDSSSSGLVAGDPGVNHVHGLGVNPADGSLYVATHHGTFRLADGRAERIGGGYQDTMGFTVAGPNRFLGSGHPDLEGMRRGQPPRLGLIESTDAGKTWRALSLSGEVDFHGLAAAHDRVYGWDSGTGRFLVSSDGRAWDTRSARPLYAFAVDPANPDHVVGAAPEGLVDSSDGGRTWRTLPGPRLVALSWDVRAGLVGAAGDGTIERSSDGGASWTDGGRLPGEPQALLATPSTLYAAAADAQGTTGIYRSTGDGSTWELMYRDRRR